MENRSESRIVKYLLIGISVLFLFVMLVLPLFVVVTEALKKGWEVYIEAVTDSYTIAALMLTLKATVIAVLCNTILGLCAAWAVTRFQFKEYSLSLSAKSGYSDRFCSSGNCSCHHICYFSVCLSGTSSSTGINRNG